MTSLDKENWNDISSRYDQSVEENRDPVIADYLQKEMGIVGNLCQRILESHNNRCSIVDMGSGTGRVIFSLATMFSAPTVQFYGVEISEQMTKIATEKKLKNFRENKNVYLLMGDSTDSQIDGLPEQGTSNIVMCMYNTLGVIHPDKRSDMVDNMLRLAGPEGLVILSTFNGDDFASAAPKLYMPMKDMVGQIDEDSFDEKNRVFQNRLGFRSQWFTRDEIMRLLKTDAEPFPINVQIDGKSHTLGNVFANRTLK